MGSSQKQKADNHRRLLQIAAKAFRENGLQSLSVAKLMETAGLTHGGFYSHFPTRDDLVREALDEAFNQARVDLFGEIKPRRGGDLLGDFIKAYLSEYHRDSPEQGCVVAALSADVARSDAETRDVYTRRFQTYVEEIKQLMSGEDDGEAKAMALLSLLAGSVLIARTVSDEGLSKKVLRAAGKLASKVTAG